MTNFGTPAQQSDDDLLESIKFWDGRVAYFVSEGDPELVLQARVAAEEFRVEAKSRGLL